jgi:predicted RNase H-like HicB family nuclease
MTFTAYVEYDEATKLYVGTVPSVAGAHSQATTLDELQANLQEVLELILEDRAANGEAIEPQAFVGIQQISIAR